MLGAAVIVAALPEYNSIQPFLQGQIRIALSHNQEMIRLTFAALALFYGA